MPNTNALQKYEAKFHILALSYKWTVYASSYDDAYNKFVERFGEIPDSIVAIYV